MKPKLTFGRYIFTLLLTVTVCVTILAININKTYKLSSEEISGLKRQIDTLELKSAKVDEISQTNTELSAQLDTLTAEISTLREEMNRQEKSDRGGERPCYSLTDSERDLVERVVMAESGGESYEGQMLVCQCILNACEINGIRPAEAIRKYAYAKGRPEPSDSVKRAVQAVFDSGDKATDEEIVYFYAPALVRSEFHESQRFIKETGGHRFFAAKE